MFDALAAIRNVDPSDGVIVAVSGGKDSVATLDLCCKHFARVEAYHLYGVPGIQFVNRYLDYLERRYKVAINRRPGEIFVGYLREGLYRARCVDISAVKNTEIKADERRRTGIRWIANGMRKCDSLQRRGMLTSGGLVNPAWNKLCPIGDWSDAQVDRYLRENNIPLAPDYSIWDRSWGYGLGGAYLAAIRRKWPADYAQIKKYFPLVDAEADRWEKVHGTKEAARDFTGHRPSIRKSGKPRMRGPEPDPASDFCDPASAAEDPQPGTVQPPRD